MADAMDFFRVFACFCQISSRILIAFDDLRVLFFAVNCPQMGTTQNPLGSSPVWVRVPPPALIKQQGLSLLFSVWDERKWFINVI